MWLELMDDAARDNAEFIYNLSYGKDSMAGLHVTIDLLGIPVNRIVHAEVWATDTIPADLPPMVEFKSKADEFIKARWGLTVEHVYATRGGVLAYLLKYILRAARAWKAYRRTTWIPNVQRLMVQRQA